MTENPKRAPVAVVSGGSSGIGRSFVAALHADGYRVFTCGRDASRLRDVERAFPGVEGFICDMSDRDAIRSFAGTVLTSSPSIDLLVSNAGVLRALDFSSPGIGSADPADEIAINLSGSIQLIASIMPGLRTAAPSRIIVVSSGYALAPSTNAPVYSASKAGLHSFCKSLRRQLAACKITVTEILPPLVDTPSVTDKGGVKLSPDDVVRQALLGAARRRAEVLPGAVRWLPLLMRIAPSLGERMVSRS